MQEPELRIEPGGSGAVSNTTQCTDQGFKGVNYINRVLKICPACSK